MKNVISKRTLKYLARFSLSHVLSYSLIAVLFLFSMDYISDNMTIAIDFFKPYNFPVFTEILRQVLKGIIIGIIIIPFYNQIKNNDKTFLYLFLMIFGLALIGSVQPMPGSIEGFYYTKTTILEHLLVMFAKSIQIVLFSYIFLKFEKSDINNEVKNHE